ncbi:hypothetical protein D3C79_770810 [compost metagenome]
MQLALGGPGQQQQHRHPEQALLRSAHGPKLGQRLVHCLLTTRNAVTLWRQQFEHDENQHRRHDHRPRRTSNQPVDPRHPGTEHLVHEAHGQQVLRRRSLDTDVPDAGALGHDDHDPGGDVGALVDAKGSNHPHHDRHHAGTAGRGAGHHQTEQNGHRHRAQQNASGADTDAGQRDQGNTPIQPGVRHCCGNEQGADHQGQRAVGKAGQGQADSRRGPVRHRRVGDCRRRTEQKGHQRSDHDRTGFIRHRLADPHHYRKGQDSQNPVPGHRQVSRQR